MVQEVRVVALLPHEDEVRRGHEDRDEIAAVRRARERIRANAEPAAVVPARVVRPELVDRPELLVGKDRATKLDPAFLHAIRLPVRNSRNQAL